jgi:hypothetical protein
MRTRKLLDLHLALPLTLALPLLLCLPGSGCSGDSSVPASSGRQYHSPNESPDYNSHLAPGAAAHDLLSADTYQSLSIEIQAMQGFEPTAQTKSNLMQFISARVNKPGGVTILDDPPIPPQGKGPYSLNDVGMIEAANRQHYTTGKSAVVYFLFLDGSSTDDNAQNGTAVLAYAYQNTSMAVFEKTIQSSSGSLPGQVSATTLETTVVEHEFGHLLGLVNLSPGTPMQTAHQDTAHGNHCNVQSCLMYWSVNTSDVLNNLISLGGKPPALDAQCLADLQGNGGK